MKEKELKEAIDAKNEIIHHQSQRISMLEEKFSELRRKYFLLKYKEDKVDFSLPKLS